MSKGMSTVHVSVQLHKLLRCICAARGVQMHELVDCILRPAAVVMHAEMWPGRDDMDTVSMVATVAGLRNISVEEYREQAVRQIVLRDYVILGSALEAPGEPICR